MNLIIKGKNKQKYLHQKNLFGGSKKSEKISMKRIDHELLEITDENISYTILSYDFPVEIQLVYLHPY